MKTAEPRNIWETVKNEEKMKYGEQMKSGKNEM